ncbi:6-phosphogluconate dehydrogenase [Aspergillus pseudoustus]|uniref:6-phosphogluconate dehydrogenase n=1 Tax=Aspergillus pseudoustus TaxID=1810923 RepID=A0ABR4IE19_9EURO
MGARMAVNLRKKMAPTATLYINDIDLTACHRFATENAHAGPIIIASSAAEVAAKCDTLLSIVPTSENVRQVYLDLVHGVVAAPPNPRRLMLECSTIEIAATREVGEAVMGKGAGVYVDTPVSGGARGAEEGTIAFLVGHAGPDPDSPSAAAAATETESIPRRIKDTVSHMGLASRVNFCGALGSGLVGKIVNNYISINNVLSLAEGMAFGIRHGVDKMTLYNCVKASSGDSWVLENKNAVPGVIARSPASNGFRATFAPRMVVKDLGLGIAAAEEVGIDASMGRNALVRFQQADRDQRTTDLDCTSIWLHMNDMVDEWVAENAQM